MNTYEAILEIAKTRKRHNQWPFGAEFIELVTFTGKKPAQVHADLHELIQQGKIIRHETINSFFYTPMAF